MPLGHPGTPQFGVKKCRVEDQDANRHAGGLFLKLTLGKGLDMQELPFGWKRKPLRNCPLCKGEGKLLWQTFNMVPPELVCVGWRRPRPGKKLPIMAESNLSEARRKIWLEFADRKSDCACVTMHRVNFSLLRNVAAHKRRVAKNARIKENDLDDPLDDLFR